MIAILVLSLLSLLVLAELQQANLSTYDECEVLSDPSDVVRVQRCKSPTVMAQTSEGLKRHGFESESRFLSDRQTNTSSFIGKCYAVLWSLAVMGTLRHTSLDYDQCMLRKC